MLKWKKIPWINIFCQKRGTRNLLPGRGRLTSRVEFISRKNHFHTNLVWKTSLLKRIIYVNHTSHSANANIHFFLDNYERQYTINEYLEYIGFGLFQVKLTVVLGFSWVRLKKLLFFEKPFLEALTVMTHETFKIC